MSLKLNFSENVILILNFISNFRTRKSKPRQTKKPKPPILDEIDFKEEIPEDLTDAILDEHEEIDDEDKPLKPKKKRKPRAKPAPGKCCTNQRIFLLSLKNVTKLLRCSLQTWAPQCEISTFNAINEKSTIFVQFSSNFQGLTTPWMDQSLKV